MTDSRRIVLRQFVACGILVALAAAPLLYGFVVGYPRRVNGRWTKRHTTWHGLSMVFPFPVRRAGWFYYYKGEADEKVEHGEFYMRINGEETNGYYRDGELHDLWTDTSATGVVRTWELYDGGHARCRCRPNVPRSEIPGECSGRLLDKDTATIESCYDWCRSLRN